jgi:hypothetical protein
VPMAWRFDPESIRIVFLVHCAFNFHCVTN